MQQKILKNVKNGYLGQFRIVTKKVRKQPKLFLGLTREQMDEQHRLYELREELRATGEW